MILAVFDFDHTLIKGDSLFHYGLFLFKKRGIRIRRLPRFIWALVGSRKGGSNESLKLSYLNMFIDGIKIEDLGRLTGEFVYDVLMGLLRKEGMIKLQWHRAQGHKVVLLSASPDLYLMEMARVLKPIDLICTRLVFGGDGLGATFLGGNCKGVEKIRRLREVTSKWDVEWGLSFAYADSYSDLPVFEAVGRPVVINPSGQLAEHARCNGWEIERWD